MGQQRAAVPVPALRAAAYALAVTAVVVALDQLAKHLAVDNIARAERVEVVFGLKLTNVRNNGVAFGLLEGAGDGLVLALTLAALAMLLVYFAVHATRPGLWLAVGLVVGGAFGNVADRARIGAAIDFIDPPLWPAFNLADIAIVVGVALLLLVILAPPEGENGAST